MMRCGDIQSWASLRVGKGTTEVWHFHEFFRMRLHVIKILWDLLLRDNFLPEGGHPKHLHLDFYFFKVYPSKQSQGCSAVVASPTARSTQRPPSAKWVWAFIDTIVECFHMVVSNHAVSLAGNVADMLVTCRPDSQMSALLADSALLCQHKTDPDTAFLCREWPTFTPFFFYSTRVCTHNLPKTSPYVYVVLSITIR
jgi:hypothetical protein